jgi:hypothetical protein
MRGLFASLRSAYSDSPTHKDDHCAECDAHHYHPDCVFPTRSERFFVLSFHLDLNGFGPADCSTFASIIDAMYSPRPAHDAHLREPSALCTRGE